MKKVIVTLLVLVTITTGLQIAFADTGKTAQSLGTTQQQVQAQRIWLGVALSSVPEVLSRQLGNVIPEKQGVMVQSVSPNSPAQKAGIQAFDVLLNYGDQKLYSAEQLAGLVSSDSANKEVTLGVVRNGIKKDIKVTLGSHSLSAAPMARHPMFGFNRQPMMPSFPRSLPRTIPRTMPDFGMPLQPAPSGKTHVMQQFESIKIKTMDGDRYHAEVEYRENGGEKKQFTFEGKYDEVREQIKSNKDLPESKKNSLLNALKNNPDQLIPDGFMDFPKMPSMPPMPSFDRFFDKTPSWFGNENRL